MKKLAILVVLVLICHLTIFSSNTDSLTKSNKNNVPKFMKILNSLDKTIEINYYLCKRKKDKKIKFFVEDKNIIKVPTFIFYNKNVEIGRIIENPNKSLLEDFLEIVF